MDEAKSWLHTPWHHLQALKGPGGGVDCAQFLRMVYINVGLAPYFETESYPHDWMMHRDEERFLKYIETYMCAIEVPGPGDAAVWLHGRCFSHGSIVLDWPLMIHAYRKERQVSISDATKERFADCAVKFYTPKRIT